MSIPDAVRHPIDALKTAPVGFAAVAISLGGIGLGATNLYEHIADAPDAGIIDEIGNFAEDAVILGSSYHISLLGLEAVGDSFGYRERIENALQRSGFNERIMKQTVKLYCNRQASLVACDRFDVKNDYLALIKKTRKTDPMKMEDRWVPHF